MSKLIENLDETIQINDKIFTKIITNTQIQEHAESCAIGISKYYKYQDIVLVTVMNGGKKWAEDVKRILRQQLNIPFRSYEISASSYQGSTKSGDLNVVLDKNMKIRGSNVIVLDDIYDTGKTWKGLKEIFLGMGARAVKLTPMVSKHGTLSQPDTIVYYIPISVPENYFLIGHGMDYQECGRNLTDIYKEILS